MLGLVPGVEQKPSYRVHQCNQLFVHLLAEANTIVSPTSPRWFTKYEHVSLILFFSNLSLQVADMALAELGRKDIMLSENEMPGLMKLRAKYVAAAL